VPFGISKASPYQGGLSLLQKQRDPTNPRGGVEKGRRKWGIEASVREVEGLASGEMAWRNAARKRKVKEERTTQDSGLTKEVGCFVEREAGGKIKRMEDPGW